MWERLSEPWRCCLEEAWAAYCAESVPIGAAITDLDGRIIARGRNRLFDERADPPLLYGHRLAHAELNALVSLELLGNERHPCVLYTTTEPCPLCVGAIRQYGVREVRYAARDPAAGSITLLEATPYMRRRPVRVIGPEEPHLEVVIMAMSIEFFRTRRAGGASEWFFDAWAMVVPDSVRIGEELAESGVLRGLREKRACASEVIDHVAEKVEL